MLVPLAGCDVNTGYGSLTYEQLVNFPVNCSKSEAQLERLRFTQKVKNFSKDIDALSEDDRAFNSRLKATIWWFEYSCNKS